MLSILRSKKIKKTIGISLLFFSAVSGVTIGVVYGSQKPPVNFDLGKFEWQGNTSGLDAIEAINNNPGITSFRNQSLDFLESYSYTYANKVGKLNKEDASNYAHQIFNEYSAKLDKEINKYLDKSFFDSQKEGAVNPLNSIYSKIVNLNNEYHIEPIDYYQFKFVSLPSIKNYYSSNSAALQKLNFLEKNLEYKVLNRHLNNFNFNNYLFSAFNTFEKESKEYVENEQSIIANEIVKMVNNKSIILNKDSSFTKELAAYSASGKDGLDAADNSILSQEQVYKLILAKRDLLGNVNLEKPSDEEKLNGESTGLNFSQNYKPLDAYVSDVEGCPSFLENEIIPGYTLHAKITNLDFTSDSNFASVDFQLGFSSTGGLDGVHWIQPEAEKDNSYLRTSFSVGTFDEKLNCAKNNFYPKSMFLEYKPKNFSDSLIRNRSTIGEILAGAPVDDTNHYTINEEHPFLVDVSNKNLPGLVLPQQLEDDHSNEKIMLAITEINTNYDKYNSLDNLLTASWIDHSNPYKFRNLIPYVEAKWVITDTNPENNNEPEIIKEIGWYNALTNSVQKTLPFYFSYSEKELELLQAAEQTTELIHNFFILAYDKNGAKTNLADYIATSIKVTKIFDESLSVLLIAGSAVSDVLMCMTSMGILGIFGAVVNCTIDVGLAVASIMVLEEKGAIIPTIKKIAELVEVFKECVPYSVAKAYSEFYNSLHDKNLSVSAKIDIAKAGKNHIWIFCKSVFEFIGKIIESTENDDFIKNAKYWMDEFKADSLCMREYIFENVVSANIGNTEEKVVQEFLNYSNKDVMKTYDFLIDEEAAKKLKDLNMSMYYSFCFHSRYFEVLSLSVGALNCLIKVSEVLAFQKVLTKSICNKDEIAFRVVAEEREIHLLHPTARGPEGIFCSNEDFIRAYDEWRASNPEKAIVFCEAQEYVESQRRFKNYRLAKLEENAKTTERTVVRYVDGLKQNVYHNVTDVKEYEKYVSRTSLNPLTKHLQLVTGAVIIIVSIVQEVTNGLLASIPDEKEDALKKLGF